MTFINYVTISQCGLTSQNFDCQSCYFITCNMILSNCDFLTAVTIKILTSYLKIITYIHCVTLYLTMWLYLRTDFIVTLVFIFATISLSDFIFQNCDCQNYFISYSMILISKLTFSQLWQSKSWLYLNCDCQNLFYISLNGFISWNCDFLTAAHNYDFIS